jgi:hypothetical protein
MTLDSNVRSTVCKKSDRLFVDLSPDARWTKKKDWLYFLEWARQAIDGFEGSQRHLEPQHWIDVVFDDELRPDGTCEQWTLSGPQSHLQFCYALAFEIEKNDDPFLVIPVCWDYEFAPKEVGGQTQTGGEAFQILQAHCMAHVIRRGLRQHRLSRGLIDSLAKAHRPDTYAENDDDLLRFLRDHFKTASCLLKVGQL